jgi:2-dehydropantoate 2-reductase
MKKHIVILGHGAIGLLWAHHLVQAHHKVTLLSRREQLPPSRQSFLTNDNALHDNQLTFSHEIPRDYDLIIVTTKAYQVHNALSHFLDNITAPIILLHNGMGAVDDLPLTNSHKVMLATTTHGALLAHKRLTHTGLGNTIIGNHQHVTAPELIKWQALLHHALTSVEVDDYIQQPLLLKLAINCVINPLTAIHQCKNGELTKPEFQSHIDALINEIQQVIPYLDTTWPYTYITLKRVIMNVAIATSNNYSSMAQDVKYKRRTEIEFINGYIVKQGEALGIDVSENKIILDKIIRLNA